MTDKPQREAPLMPHIAAERADAERRPRGVRIIKKPAPRRAVEFWEEGAHDQKIG